MHKNKLTASFLYNVDRIVLSIDYINVVKV